MTFDQIYNFVISYHSEIATAILFLGWVIFLNRWAYWKSKANSSNSADVIKALRENLETFKISNINVHNEARADRKALQEALESHARQWRRMSDRLLRDGKAQPEESGFSDEALRRIGSFAAGEIEASDWLDEICEEIGVEGESCYTETVEALIKARKG